MRNEVISAKGRHVSSRGRAAGRIWTLGASFAHPKRRRHYLIFDGRPDVSIQGTIWAIGQCHNKRPFFAVFRAAMMAKIMLFIISPHHVAGLGSIPIFARSSGCGWEVIQESSALDMAPKGLKCGRAFQKGFFSVDGDEGVKETSLSSRSIP